MKKIYKIIFLLILYSAFSIHNSFSQSQLVKQWDYSYGGDWHDYLTAFQRTADGGYILGGFSSSDSSGDKTQNTFGYDDYWIVKTDAFGTKQWDKDYGGVGGNRLYSVNPTTDGGYIIGGWTTADSSGDKTEHTRDTSINQFDQGDYWIVKIDSLGNKQWDKAFGGKRGDYLYCVKETFDGGYILGGYSCSDSSGDKSENNQDTSINYNKRDDYWIVKTDSSGQKEWDKTFGGARIDRLMSLQQTADEGFILGGYSSSGISGDKTQSSRGMEDYWIVKVDKLGNKQWDKRFGGNYNDELGSLYITVDGGLILGGSSSSDSSGDKTQANCQSNIDYWIVKIDAAGNFQFDNTYGGSLNETHFFQISQTPDGGYLLAGISSSDSSCEKTENDIALEQSWVVKTDGSGNKIWDKTLRTNAVFYDVFTAFAVWSDDNCYTIANCTGSGIGWDKTQDCKGGLDYWMIKFCDTSSTIGIPNLQSSINNLQFSPNPLTTQSKLTFKNINKEKFLFTLYDITGRITETVSTTNNEIILTKGSKPAGVYIYNLTNEKTGERWRGKIVIE